jgi:MFS family permease
MPCTGPPFNATAVRPSRGARGPPDMPKRVLAVSTVMALALLGDSLLYVVLPLHAPALGLSAFQVGVLLSANRWVRMLTNTAAARLVRRFHPRAPFTAAAGLAALTTAMYTLTPAFGPFLLARLAWGLSFSTLRLGCFITVLAAAADTTRGRLMGAYGSISRAGSFTAVMAGGALFDAYGYRAALLSMAAGTALAVPLAALTAFGGPHPSGADGDGGDRAAAAEPSARRRESPPDAAASWWARGSRPPVPSPILAVKWSGFAQAFVARGVVTATLSLYLSRAFGERFGPGGIIGVATLAAWLVGVRWASEIGLAAPLGALSDRVGRARAAVVWLLVAAAAVLALALAPAVGVAAGAAAALFVAGSGLGATLDAAAGDLAPPHRRAEVMTAYADWTDFGAALGPLLALTLAGSLGLRPVYAAGAGLLVVGALGITLAFSGKAGTPRAATAGADR